ncbi:hypothetical protein FRB90_009182, partial [Tulasnella sp. 427]
MDDNYIRRTFNRPTTASSIPEDSELSIGLSTTSRSNRGKQTSYESVIAFDLGPTASQQTLSEDSQQSSAADADLRPMVD